MAEHAPLVVIALELEGQGLFEQADVGVLYTGLGKVNAALSLARRLASLRAQGTLPKMVVNFGTAGSRMFATGSVIACREFVQRDMDVTGLGFALGETPFEALPATLSFPAVFRGLAEGVCGTGDRFETGALGLPATSSTWKLTRSPRPAWPKACRSPVPNTSAMAPITRPRTTGRRVCPKLPRLFGRCTKRCSTELLGLVDLKAQGQSSLHDPLVRQVRAAVTPGAAPVHVGEGHARARFQADRGAKSGTCALALADE